MLVIGLLAQNFWRGEHAGVTMRGGTAKTYSKLSTLEANIEAGGYILWSLVQDESNKTKQPMSVSCCLY